MFVMLIVGDVILGIYDEDSYRVEFKEFGWCEGLELVLFLVFFVILFDLCFILIDF